MHAWEQNQSQMAGVRSSSSVGDGGATVPAYAHSNPAFPHDCSQWELLFDGSGGGHLERVTELACGFAREFAGEGGNPFAVFAEALLANAALWHDMGKYSAEFQDYLRKIGGAEGDGHQAEVQGGVDHSTAGAKHAANALPGWGHLLAYLIAGHHSGLPDWDTGLPGSLKARLNKEIFELKHVPKPVSAGVPVPPVRALPPDGFACAFFARILFSALVDADFLATQEFMDSTRADERRNVWPAFRELDGHLTRWSQSRFAGVPEGEVALQRQAVRNACLNAAEMPPGLFALTVPTGGGKTLSSLAFALRHASRHHLQRVIYAIPFTSIIEQNAGVFREIFDSLDREIVLEHHSSFDCDKETVSSRLATGNWDAPLVVTTNVQFFESLFAHRTSRCRKLHRIARSVIILDEVQTLPVTLLKPCLRALQELVTRYGCTVVLCTATQPALVKREGEFEFGLEKPVEIIPDAPALYTSLKRVEVRDAGQLGADALAGRLAAEVQVLCIVSTKRHAADVFNKLRDRAGREDVYHLSAAMCPEHRSQVLGNIRTRLEEGAPCRVVSTQLIEAGVDVDFPVVYRCLAGLDSIAQAAGRCNRNGRRERGTTWVFRPDPAEHRIPRGYLSRTAGFADEVLPLHADPLSLEAVEHYFRLHYWAHSHALDKQGIVGMFNLNADPSAPFVFNFAEASSKFRFIDGDDQPVIIPFDSTARRLIEDLRYAERAGRPFSVRTLRKLQRYTVTIPKRRWQENRHCLELLFDRFPVLISPELHYSDETGLRLPDGNPDDPESLIVE